MAGRIQNEDIKSAAELVSGGGTAAQLPNDDKVYVTASGINKTLKQAIIDGDITGGGGVYGKEVITLDATDISNGYVDLAVEAVSNSLDVYFEERILTESVAYTTSVVTVTRVTFAGSYAAGGDAELVEGDVLSFKYVEA